MDSHKVHTRYKGLRNYYLFPTGSKLAIAVIKGFQFAVSVPATLKFQVLLKIRKILLQFWL